MTCQGGMVSPRWSGEILDCSMPMTFDTYSSCSFNCLYCFSFFQKSHAMSDYQGSQVKSVTVSRVAALFGNALAGRIGQMNKRDREFAPYIMSRKVMQWGALADQFDSWERKHGVTLALLRIFDALDYPLSFSTKSVWWTEEPEYMRIFARHRHNWHVKISIITMDEAKARAVELGCPTPKARIAALRRLADMGIQTTLRLRPYIIGISEDALGVIDAAADAGVKSVSTEFFCMEARADKAVKDRYSRMSLYCGRDIWRFYMDNSEAHGYKRLSRAMKLPIALAMREKCRARGVRFVSSDAHLRDLNESVNCCGVPPSWNYCVDHFGGAVLRAKNNGFVTFPEIWPGIQAMFGFRFVGCSGFNTSGSRLRASFSHHTMADWIRDQWNNQRLGKCPGQHYECLEYAGLGSDGNAKYKYKGVRS